MAERTNFEDEFRGLSGEEKRTWPSVTVPYGDKPIDHLRPGSEAHDRVRDYLLDRLEASERAMRAFYARWRINEMKLQAFISLPQWEKDLKAINDTGAPPKVTSVIIPYSMATISTIVTYHLHTFASRKPILQVGTYKDETVKSARNMETVLQYNADHTKLVRHLFHGFQDGQIYGFNVWRVPWIEEWGMRTRRTLQKKFSVFGKGLGRFIESKRQKELVYQGNGVISQDPFMFFPDPNVPMEDVNTKGEYVFWRSFEGKHSLLKLEADEVFKWVKETKADFPHGLVTAGAEESARALLSGGRPTPGFRDTNIPHKGSQYMQVDQGTVEIIPRELGLGESTRTQKWMFALLNKAQVIQAEPFDSDHDMHPVAVTEPYSLGYGFGHPGMVDFLHPLQDVISWLINSHMDNVRKVLNDVIIVDPSAIEMQDLKNPSPGKLIRLKRSAIGRDVRTIIQQLAVSDVTQNHMADAQIFIRMGQLLSAVGENVMGLQQAGGRKTATEVRSSMESATSRLAAQSRVLSSQGLVDLTKMWSLNVQQHVTEDFYLQVLGQEGAEDPIHITPDQLTGDFHYPVHDGTLPLDRIASFDIWKEVFQGVLQDQELRQNYSVPRLFEFIAELGGAKNIEAMRIGVQPDDEVEAGVQSGNVVPISQGGPSGLVNALGGGRPAGRAMGSMTS
jgi:hypothetical protein